VETSGRTATCSTSSIMALVLWVFFLSEAHTDYFLGTKRCIECHIGQSDTVSCIGS
jgi:hypothetical protein